jgi:hypothetical protein
MVVSIAIMADVTRLADRRPSDASDPVHVSQDQWGRPTFEYSGDYQLGGRTWNLRFWAFDLADAEELAERWGLMDVGQVIEEGVL